MCETYVSNDPEVARLRRKAVTFAALTACMGAVPALAATHGHHVLMFVVIMVQVSLLVMALVTMRRARELQRQASVEDGPKA